MSTNIGIQVVMVWPEVALQVNIMWLLVIFGAMIVWHALTGGRRHT